MNKQLPFTAIAHLVTNADSKEESGFQVLSKDDGANVTLMTRQNLNLEAHVAAAALGLGALRHKHGF